LTGKTVIAFGTLGSGNYSHIIVRVIWEWALFLFCLVSPL